MTDEELLLRIQDRDLQALSALYDRYSRVVYGLLVDLLRDTDEAEDATQEVFLRIWNKASTFQTGFTSTKSWILRVAHNRGLNLLRARRIRQKRIIDGLELEYLESIPSDPLDTALMHAGRSNESSILRDALGDLTADHRELIELAFLKGYSHSEIAEMTSLPLGTIKTRIRSALKHLRLNLQPFAKELSDLP
jgi:RNA polymerase sigma-70 factor (ECF subfamily)